MAEAKHSVKSYYGLNKKKSGDEGDLLEDDKPVVDEVRLQSLAQPRNKERHKIMHDLKQLEAAKLAA